MVKEGQWEGMGELYDVEKDGETAGGTIQQSVMKKTVSSRTLITHNIVRTKSSGGKRNYFAVCFW
jgi:hypothetical protein